MSSEPPPGRDRGSMSLLSRRATILTVCLAAVAAGYILFFAGHFAVPPPAEVHFDQGAPAGGGLHVYVDIQAFDPTRDTLDVTFEFRITSVPPISQDTGGQDAGAAASSVLARMTDGQAERDFILRPEDTLQPRSGFINISRGALGSYPFDRYTAGLKIDASDRGAPSSGPPLPLHVTVWQRLAAWDIRVARIAQAADGSGMDLRFAVSRPYQFRFFAVTLYAAMALMGCAGITIGCLTFLGIRRLDTTLAAVLSAMTFSLPALRNVMPGAPPLGVAADGLVFLWAELAVVIGLTLVIITWARLPPA